MSPEQSRELIETIGRDVHLHALGILSIIFTKTINGCVLKYISRGMVFQ